MNSKQVIPVGVNYAARKALFCFLVPLLASLMPVESASEPAGQDEQPDYLAQALDLVCTTNTPNGLLIYGISEAYLSRGEKDKALAVLNKMESIEDRVDALIMLADGFFSDYKTKSDPSLLEQAFRLNDKLQNTGEKEFNYIAIGSIYSENNMPDEADQALEAALACAELPVQDDSNQGQRAINNASRANRMASIYAKAGRTNEFERAQARAAILINNIQTPMFKESGQSKMAANYAAMGQYNRSMEITQKIKGKNRKASALGKIALEMAKAGQTAKAMEIVHEWSSYTNKFFSSSFESLALQQAKAGEWPNAYTITEIIDNPKNRADTYIDLAALHLTAGNRQEALKLLQKTRSISKGQDPKKWDRIFARLAEVYADAGQFSDAIEIASMLSDEPPFYGIARAKSSAYARIAEGYAKNGKFDEAIQTANSLPDEVKKLYTLIEIANIQSDVPTAAKKTLELAVLQLGNVDDPAWRAGGLIKIDKVYYQINHPKEKQ